MYEPVKLAWISMEKDVSVRVPVESWKRYVPEKDERIVQCASTSAVEGDRVTVQS